MDEEQKQSDPEEAEATPSTTTTTTTVVEGSQGVEVQVAPVVSAAVLNLWNEVGNGLEKNQTVVWKASVESLDHANRFLGTGSPEARSFMEKYMTQIVGILVDQVPSKIGTHEKECVQESLMYAVQLVAQDLEIQIQKPETAHCVVLRTLEHLFSKRKNYFKGNSGKNNNWHHHHHGGMNQGLPELRTRLIEKFHQRGGFKSLCQYMKITVGSPRFLELETLRHILLAVPDMIPNYPIVNAQATFGPNKKNQHPNYATYVAREDDIIAVGRAVMGYITHMADDDLKKIPVEQLSTMQQDLQTIFDRLVVTRREATLEFYAFWRNLVYKLLTNPSLPLKLFGWESVTDLIDACEKHRPPPRTFWVQNAGNTFCNGLYQYAGPVTPSGYYRPLFDREGRSNNNNSAASEQIMYVRTIPQSEHPNHQAGHKLTLFRCTMRSQQKWWFLSEADEEQPGTDRDVDYYQHKSLKDQEEAYPPASGWATCRTAGNDPPPNLSAIGWMVPVGEERNTLEHELAKWAISQKIVEQVLGDTTSHREVVARSTALIKFLAQMCSREDGVLMKPPPEALLPYGNKDTSNEATMDGDEATVATMSTTVTAATAEDATAPGTTTEADAAEPMSTDEEAAPTTALTTTTPDEYCLQASHLLFAWKTCTRKADAAVSAQVYQLLVSILPLCPPNLAIPLLQAVQASLDDPQLNSEVGEFCGALAEGNFMSEKAATANNASNNSKSGGFLHETVRMEILNLLWAVLTHPEALALKSYEGIKRYVSFELRGDKGVQHRKRFLQSSLNSLQSSAATSSATPPINEDQALLMVKLTYFVMEACPRMEANLVAANNNSTIPLLLFNELKAYLMRQKEAMAAASSGGVVSGFRKQPHASTSSLSSTTGVNTGTVVGASTVAAAAGAAELTNRMQQVAAMRERLQILRHMYGLSDPRLGAKDTLVMTADMIKTLWSLCSPTDREWLIVFLAGASHNGRIHGDSTSPVLPQSQQGPQQQSIVDPNVLSPAFTEDVCRSVFLDLFCYNDNEFDYENIGASGYRSFHFLFNSVRRSPQAVAAEKRAALDAQWRMCLRAGNHLVAQQAMRDLLTVYITAANDRHDIQEKARASFEQQQQKTTNSQMMEQDDSTMASASPATPQASWEDEAAATVAEHALEDDFGERIFQCLSKVRTDISSKTEDSADRAAERCIRILNAAVGQQIDGAGSYSNTPSALTRLSTLPLNATLDTTQKCLPHGLRGEAACFHVAVTARRNPIHNSQQNLMRAAAEAEGAPAQPQLPNTSRFTLDLHPLETIQSVKRRISAQCECSITSVKPLHITGRRTNNNTSTVGGTDTANNTNMSLNSVPEDSVMDELGIVHGCEIVVSISDRVQNNVSMATSNRTVKITNDLSEVFFSHDSKFADQLFISLLELLDILSLSSKEIPSADASKMEVDNESALPSNPNKPTAGGTSQLIWDLLQSMPTNSSILTRVQSATGKPSTPDAMEIDSVTSSWDQLLDVRSLNKAVYVLLTIDALLNPALAALSILPMEQRIGLEQLQRDEEAAFRKHFVDSGGFAAVVAFFSREQNPNTSAFDSRRGNAVALRILKSCLFAEDDAQAISTPDGGTGGDLLQSLSSTEGLLKSLTSMVVDDSGVPSSTVMDVLRFLRLLFNTPNSAAIFMNLPRDLAKRLITSLMVKDEQENAETGRFSSSSIKTSMHVRTSVSELILQTPLLADSCLAWLIDAVERVEVTSETTTELFNTVEKLVSDANSTARTCPATDEELRHLAYIVCKTLSQCPRPVSEADLVDITTGVLCGCLKLLRALVGQGKGGLLRQGTDVLLGSLSVEGWSSHVNGVSPDDAVMLDLMGVVFDGLLNSSANSSVAICCDKDSRREGFDVVAAIAQNCQDGQGYTAIVNRMNNLIDSCAPSLRHRWGEFGGQESPSRLGRAAKYSGLRNQGCTCYMNSALQQLFMMPELRDSMCAAPLPSSLRSSGSVTSKGVELVDKKISLQWESSISYDAVVERYDEASGMHTIRYDPIQVATVGGAHHQHQQVRPDDIDKLPLMPAEEFVLAEGRPGKETGIYEVIPKSPDATGEETNKNDGVEPMQVGEIKESEDQISSRHLLEEVQRTFIHLAEGSKGRCFDPRALVEACTCLKLEFDVWQQNDASEFVTKLLDRLEASLKKWAPTNFKYLDHTFGLKQTRQKICKECGLKTNKEEKLINIDCQIRGKTDIHEALATMTEADVMEGSNKVSCDRCKKKTDTILRTAVSTLPNMLILSLKRFDLDFTTFETVKLNSRCAFGQTLNMKPYTIEGIEALEAAGAKESSDPSPMETDSSEVDPLAAIPDEDYEYKLAGVLVHAGVAQGGHYYSFIRDRSPDGEEKWYRFDDEDVTPFNQASIETECFGGKVKKETKWPNGQVHTVEQEQFANALMLFYEKVKPSAMPEDSADTDGTNAEEKMEQNSEEKMNVSTSDGFDVFKPDVQRTNATHKLQSFLFDSECQTFLKGLLGMCLPAEFAEDQEMSIEEWRGSLLQMILSYFFDVFLYSADRPNLNDWADALRETLLLDKLGSQGFVRKLAKKTNEVSSNWLRTYLADCPDKVSREASVKVFAAAIESCAHFEKELSLLNDWAIAFNEMVTKLFDEQRRENQDFNDYPASLTDRAADSSILEDCTKIDSGEASSVGIIISQINALFDYIPRCWRYSVEPCTLICELANATVNDEYVFRKAMIAALTPARVVAFTCRERSPRFITTAFPGVAIASDTANTQIRAESNPHHIMPMGSSQVVASDLKNSRSATQQDYVVMLEALACLGGIPGFPQVPLYHESDDGGHALDRVSLTQNAIAALTVVFKESCAPDAPGMGQREIEVYLRKSSVEASQFSPQKITELMAKYPAQSSRTPTQIPYLSLEGFIAFYKDLVQTNEARIFQDLHSFGFRPDLSRRSRSARWVTIQDREHERKAPESVGVDLAESLDGPVELGLLANQCLAQTNLLLFAFDTSEPLAEYLAAASVYKRESDSIITQTLRTLHSSPNDWGGNASVSNASRALSVIVAVPDEHQESRIALVMLSKAVAGRNADYGGGLLHVLKTFYRGRQGHNYNNEVHWGLERYFNVFMELRQVYNVYKWTNENKEKWSFMERDVNSNRSAGQYQSSQQRGGDYNQRDAEYPVDALPLDHNSHTDSDMAGNHESEEDDDDSQCDALDDTYSHRQRNSGPYQIKIEGAGTDDVNGTYNQDGIFENSCKYSKSGKWKNNPYKFYVFQCNVSNNTRHWYVSIVPSGGSPGTSADIDFYTAPVTADCTQVPPSKGWVKGPEGAEPMPTVSFVDTPEGGTEENGSWIATGDGDENQQGTQHRYV